MHTLRIMLLLAAPCLLAQEMLTNGDFKKGLSAWTYIAGTELKGKASPKIQRVDGRPAFVLTVPEHEGKVTNGAQVHQRVAVETGKTYRVTLVCRGEGEGQITFKVNHHQKPWRPCGFHRHFELEKEWTRYVGTFNVPELIPDNPVVLRLIMCTFIGDIYLRELSLKEVDPEKVDNSVGKLEIEPLAKTSSPGKSPQSKPPGAKGAPLTSSALLKTFDTDAEAATTLYKGKRLRISGPVTNLEPALLGDILLELEGGRISILLAADAIGNEQLDLLKRELAAAKRRIAAFTKYARQKNISAADQRKRSVDALPTVTLTTSFIGQRNDSVKMRQGKGLVIDKGRDLVPK